MAETALNTFRAVTIGRICKKARNTGGYDKFMQFRANIFA